MTHTKCSTALGIAAMLVTSSAYGQTPASPPPDAPVTFQTTVQVTATRFGEPVVEVPGSISVVTGDELRARGANDLRTALALVGGVSVAPGGLRAGGPRGAGSSGAPRGARRAAAGGEGVVARAGGGRGACWPRRAG